MIYIRDETQINVPRNEQYNAVYWRASNKERLMCSSLCPHKRFSPIDSNTYICLKYDYLDIELSLPICLKECELEILLHEL